MATSIPFRLAQATGLLGAAWLSGTSLFIPYTTLLTQLGNIAALSLMATPALTTQQSRDNVSSSTLARQWQTIFSTGKAQNPPVAAVAAASFSYLAWTLRSVPGNRAWLYGTAAVFTIGIAPWTILAMTPTNEKLIKKAEGKVDVKGDEEEVRMLLKRWSSLNGIRSLLPLAGAALGLFTVLA